MIEYNFPCTNWYWVKLGQFFQIFEETHFAYHFMVLAHIIWYFQSDDRKYLALRLCDWKLGTICTAAFDTYISHLYAANRLFRLVFDSKNYKGNSSFPFPESIEVKAFLVQLFSLCTSHNLLNQFLRLWNVEWNKFSAGYVGENWYSFEDCSAFPTWENEKIWVPLHFDFSVISDVPQHPF